MADESSQESQQRRRPKAILEDYADIKIANKFSINLRILLEPIGILKIILIFVAMFAFSLTAGYSSTGTNSATCMRDGDSVIRSVEISYRYPYHSSGYTYTYTPSSISDQLNATCFSSLGRKTFTGSAEYFVAMSTFTFLYAILCIPFYIFFYPPSYDVAKYFSIIDLVISCILLFFYFLADIAWSAGPTQLNSYFSQLLTDKRSDCLGRFCTNLDSAPSPSVQNTVQLSFSLLFGWVAVMLLGATLWFIYKDTIVHEQRMGPIYHLPFCKRRQGSGSSTAGPSEETYIKKDPEQATPTESTD